MSACWTCQGHIFGTEHEDAYEARPIFDCLCDFELPFSVNREIGKESRERAERRQLDRTTCAEGGCDLPKYHVGTHRGACGCLNGCEAQECPNV